MSLTRQSGSRANKNCRASGKLEMGDGQAPAKGQKRWKRRKGLGIGLAEEE